MVVSITFRLPRRVAGGVKVLTHACLAQRLEKALPGLIWALGGGCWARVFSPATHDRKAPALPIHPDLLRSIPPWERTSQVVYVTK